MTISLFRDKSNYIFLSIVVLSFIIVFFSFYCFLNYNDSIDDLLYESVDFRTIMTDNMSYSDSVEARNEILKIDHVVDVFDNYYSEVFGKTDIFIKNGSDIDSISLKRSSKGDPLKVIKGRKFSDDENNVLICPDKMCSQAGHCFDSKMIDMTNTIGTSFEVTFKSYYNGPGGLENKYDLTKTFDKKFTIIGLYDSRDNDYDFACFAPYSDVEEIVQNSMAGFEENNYHQFDVIVDSRSNVDYVLNQLMEKGYIDHYNNYTVLATLDDEEIEQIHKLLLYTFLMAIILVIIIVIAYSIKNVINNAYNIGLLKALGFSNGKIIRIYLKKLSIIVFTSFIISNIIFYFIKELLKYYSNKNVYLYYFDYIDSIYIYLAGLAIIYFISISIYMFVFNIVLKKNAIKLLKIN